MRGCLCAGELQPPWDVLVECLGRGLGLSSAQPGWRGWSAWGEERGRSPGCESSGLSWKELSASSSSSWGLGPVKPLPPFQEVWPRPGRVEWSPATSCALLSLFPRQDGVWSTGWCCSLIPGSTCGPCQACPAHPCLLQGVSCLHHHFLHTFPVSPGAVVASLIP